MVAAKLLVVGGGKMGEALIRGLLRSGWARPDQVVVTEVSEARRAQLGDAPDLAGIGVLSGELAPAEGAVVAVKPPDVEAVCRRLAGAGVPRVLSIAAGIGLDGLEVWCGDGTAVVRAMPNIAALVGSAATAVAGGSGASREDLDWAVAVMSAVGTVVEVPEHLLDAVTGVSGSGPAYIFLMVEALTEGGVLMGLPRPVAAELVTQTLLGSARLLAETGESAGALRGAVTSPGGTTAAALRRLEASGTRSAFIEAVAAAVQRSRELGAPAADVHGP